MNTTPPDLADLEEMVLRLGNTADEVATTLRRAGITGKQKEPDCCAIANYLTFVGFDGIRVELDLDDDVVISTADDSADATSAVAEFVEGFDAGRYPDLIGGAA